MKELIQKIRSEEHLSQSEIESVMQEIMSGQAQENEIAEFLISLRKKGATIDEITGAAKVMRKFVIDIPTKQEIVLDTCGTGGDKKNTFNISTVTAIVVAGAGVTVAKHGNRSVSSKCGSADILEALGVNLDLTQDQIRQCLDEVGLAFLFAQKLHPAMKNVAQVRKKLGVETIFNVLGPLTNPAEATHQMMGVYNRDLVEPLANVLKNLGLKKAMVVHGEDGLDEITTCGKTFISEFNGEEIYSYDISPDELGIPPAKGSDLTGGDVDKNVSIVYNILEGKMGPKRDIVVLNAAYALYITEKADDLEQAFMLANQSIDLGHAAAKLKQLINFTHQFNDPGL
ncbi:MAG: anthranilate phosphoribosyltransferase [Candidatus Omnitrophica bacterium]|nr:anthranilate phosphoribosyltransferase [Candidatus Omnitrophota bacterium]